MKSINSNLKYLNNTIRDHKLGRTASKAPWDAGAKRRVSRIALFRYFILCILCSAWSIGFNSVSALEYSTNAGIDFTINPSINVSLSSSDIYIDDLAPNTSSDSNVLIINVTSNNSTGYVLNSSVGNSSTYASNLDNLVNTTSSSYKFTNLALNADLTSIDDSTEPNVWGYSYATTLTTNVETNHEEWNWSNYSGLPLYSDTTNIATLKSSNTPSSANGDSIGFKIAAKASNAQIAGDYTNIINFMVVGNVVPVSFYDAFTSASEQPGSTITKLNGYYKMQDMTPAICDAVRLYDDNSHIQLIDTRDNEVYWIGKLKDNRCWLLDNLRLGSNDHSIDLTPEDTNIAEAWTLPRGITNNFNSYTIAQINAAYKDNTDITSYGTASGKVGTYYNYCAASGGTYCYPGNEGASDAIYDSCSKNWHMPSLTEYVHLYNKNNNAIETFRNSISMNFSGVFSVNAAQFQDERGILWSRTFSTGSMMVFLYDSDTRTSFTDSGWRQTGRSIRCIANNS